MNTETEKENATLPEQRQLRTLHLFAGAGGGILADILLGHRPVGAVEIEEYPRRVLLARQRDGILPKFPIWDDVSTFDGKPWRGRVDVVCGGFPCQDISSAGKGAGIAHGTRSGLWFEMSRIIREIRPRSVFVENSALLTSRGLGIVLGDLAEMGFDAKWGVFCGHHAGGFHRRSRIWILADSNKKRQSKLDFDFSQFEKSKIKWKATFGDPSKSPRNTDGVANRVDRLAATGNGQVPAVAALAWRILTQKP